MAITKDQARKRDENTLFTRQKYYQGVFDKEAPAVQEVLKDLAKFCRANQSTFDADPRIHAALEGRREVYLRILDHIELSSQELWERITGTKY